MTSTEQGRKKYDRIADRYEDIFRYVADVGRQLVDYADPRPGARTLDIGAGRGAVARVAHARGCVVTATDASAGMVERLGADFPEITARQMDAGSLGFADASFELVTAGFVVQVLDDPGLAIAECRRVLAPAGVVALSLERPFVGRMGWLHDLNAEFFGTPPEQADGAGPLTAQRLDGLLAAAGFADVTRTSIDISVPMADPDALWNWLAMQGLPDILSALPGDRAAEFRDRFLVGAEHMHAHGGIAVGFGATLHRAHVPG
ncbi:class I SAM-dependent methyltransferase [Actinokineospora sp.]|uniref:class I SAM-dependent methyltransferase n=1 Tax=Actinokineospora sp. TaxID=1872133 RepID=UPI0040381B5D